MAPHSLDRFQVARFLRMQTWFAHLSPVAQERVIRLSHTLRVRKGDVALCSGEVACGWYAVLSGFVKLQSPGVDDEVSAFLALTGGEWFGEGSALQDEPRRYEVVALRDTELLCLPRAQFHELLASNVTFANAVLRHMNQRLAQAMAIIEANRTGTLEQRLALYLSRTFWHDLRPLNLSQEELGTLAGMSRQTTNRALRQLAERGLVSLRHGRVVATDAAGLERFRGSPSSQTQHLAA